ncbi:hypothetical protein ACHGLA_14735 [Streptomyces sp. YH02]|uniref:hypothetical protein n=1 Tax=Streptomyces sp. YH02 TaxID=3256999 RepID=UPI003757014F
MSARSEDDPSTAELYRILQQLREEMEAFKGEQRWLREKDQERAARTKHLIASAIVGPLVVGLVLYWMGVRGSA